MDYHCNCCGFDFLEAEGYEPAIDAIVCPMCGATRWSDEDDHIIEETR
jgi:rubredoxin